MWMMMTIMMMVNGHNDDKVRILYIICICINIYRYISYMRCRQNFCFSKRTLAKSVSPLYADVCPEW